jgi:hypothetical protein
VAHRAFLAFLLLFFVAACASPPDRQWYKPGGNYTVAEFQRDAAACTKNKNLDEDCLKQRGWVSLSGDAPPPRAKTIEERERERLAPPGSGTGRY